MWGVRSEQEALPVGDSAGSSSFSICCVASRSPSRSICCVASRFFFGEGRGQKFLHEVAALMRGEGREMWQKSW